MNTQPSPAPLKIYPPHASSIIVHRVPAQATEAFLEWERQITSAAAAFPGYQSTEAYTPCNPALEDWVVLMHFDSPAALEAWLKSDQRARCMAQLPLESSRFQVQKLPAGLGDFLLHPNTQNSSLPHWKAFLTVLAALYPTAMLLTLYLSPHIHPLGLPLVMLISNALSVSFLEYLAMPTISKIFAPWLHANGPENRTSNIIGVILIIAVLALMTLGFSRLY